ncbi:MAG TPA: hypothetical protein VFO79_15245 [Xanthomonadales bacterium]|nr:hypothetical protein [Xanthomonadales bacterium]
MRNFVFGLFLVVSGLASAATYQVGPTRTHTNLNALFAAVDLAGGDVVEVDGGVIYDVGTPGVVMPAADGGDPGNPVILRGIKVGGQRPHLRGGTNTIEFRLSNHVVFEGFEVSGTGNTSTGTFRCVYHHSHDLVIRDAYIHDCPRHGILGADQDSGSLLVEYSEVFNAGSNNGNHAIYMATDEVAHPGAVFRLQYSWIHDSQFDPAVVGGNLIKSRAERNEIYYNWLEDAFYHELELIGPDPGGAQAGWNDGLAREDSDVVGNVIVHTASFGAVLRFGGDGTGESFGRYRVVNNTIVRRNANDDQPTVFRLFEGIDALEFHNNVIWREGPSTVTLIRAVTGEVQWNTGVAKVTGSNNWIDTGFTFNPSNVPHTIGTTYTGTDPGFANLAAYDLSPAAGSPLLDIGNPSVVSPTTFEIASPLFPPAFHPPVRALLPVGSAALRGTAGVIDIGAFERAVVEMPLFADGFEG